MRSLMVAVFLVALSFAATAQSGGKAEVFASQDLLGQRTALEAKAKAAGSAGVTLADYGSHKVQISVRTESGGGEIHARFDDVMIVQQGTATLITGGTIIDGKTGADGETKGSGIKGGKSQAIGPGDIVTVNAGVPHQLLVPPGTTYSALVIKVKE